jgi:hypothetical protein
LVASAAVAHSASTVLKARTTTIVFERKP